MAHCIRCGIKISDGEVTEIDDMCLECVELLVKNKFPPRFCLIFICALILGTLTPYLLAVTMVCYAVMRLIKLRRKQEDLITNLK